MSPGRKYNFFPKTEQIQNRMNVLLQKFEGLNNEGMIFCKNFENLSFPSPHFMPSILSF